MRTPFPTINSWIHRGERQAALDIANEVRRQLDLPPVDKLYRGAVADANSCPITNTIYDDDLDRKRFKVVTQYGFIRVRQVDPLRDWQLGELKVHLDFDPFDGGASKRDKQALKFLRLFDSRSAFRDLEW